MEPAPLNSPGHSDPLIFWVDERAIICRSNATALSMLGMTSADVIGRPMSGMLAAGSQERLDRAGEGQRLLMELCRGDGRRLWTAYSVQAASGEPGALSTHTAAPLASALGELLDERIQAERRTAHRELLGHVSHNVNNLLTTILSPAQLLLEGIHDPDAREDILDILQATQRARALLREMYRAVRFEPESMESMPLAPLLSDVVARPMVDELQVRLDLPPLPPVLGVSDGLRTILHSLLSNAAEAGAKTVRITARHEGDRVLLSIADDGSGIEAAQLARLFEPFATSKPRVGAGLSLATSRTRLLGWGGGISAASTPGAGAILTLTLQTAPVPVKPQHPMKGRVLLVEDEPIIARTLKRIFSLHHVDTALNAHSALQMFSPGEYDAVLIDLGLPEMPGSKLAAYLRDQDTEVSMLMLTGWMIGNDDPRMRLFDGRIQKPIDDLARVRRKLAEAIQRTRDRRSG